MTVHARINHGIVEVQDPIPPTWEGQLVKLVLLTPDDEVPNINQRIAALHALGPMEFESDEREKIASALSELDQVSKKAMASLSSLKP